MGRTLSQSDKEKQRVLLVAFPVYALMPENHSIHLFSHIIPIKTDYTKGSDADAFIICAISALPIDNAKAKATFCGKMNHVALPRDCG